MRNASTFALVMLLSLTACSRPSESREIQRSSNHDSITFRGICDGSAAVKLDNETILVAYDESNTLFAYDVAGGESLASVDLAAMLNLSTDKEMDIEAATVSGQQIWWLGSQSLDRKGAIAPNRQMFFATNIPSTDLDDIKLLTQPVDLNAVLMKSEKLAKVLTAASGKRQPKEGGINIEGLAAAVDYGFIVGFRSPLKGPNGISGEAVVARIIPDKESFSVQQVFFLDLANRGVRDIVNTGNGYIIIAGPVASAGEFALYSWDGHAHPEQLMVLSNLNAEGLVYLGHDWLVLSDDGKVRRADETAGSGFRNCDRIRRKHHLGSQHPGVYFRAEKVSGEIFP